MLESKLPKLLILVRVVPGVLPGMLIAPAVSQPYIVTSIGEHKSRSLVFVIDEPGVGTVEQSVQQ